mmetsp:Transcript_2633/g.3130  ORF Transcript_2633/g.3130 Transcript_2633/m.3130 type:complete len:359 (+) Transcript_2633:136-1212(+)
MVSCSESRSGSYKKTLIGGGNHNPLVDKQRNFLGSLTKNERENFFSTDLVEAERRAEIWMHQADVGSDLVEQFSWATPDSRAIKILKHFGPIVEIGCGANAYWCRAMEAAGIDVVGYDIKPEEGGKINHDGSSKKEKEGKHGFSVNNGGPEVLSKNKSLHNRTLFLCYPDEDELEEADEGQANYPISMAALCLQYFKGTHVVHVGELYCDTLSKDQAPWGRSSSPEFQSRLASEYHCLLRATLTNWLHVRDTISVWKRSETCSIIFAGEEGVDDDEEEIEYRHIPMEEKLPTDVAAPCLANLLVSEELHNGKGQYKEVQELKILNLSERNTDSITAKGNLKREVEQGETSSYIKKKTK